MKKEWFQWLVWDKIRIRFRLERSKGQIIDIVVQLEIYEDGWNELIRYNYAHGRPHKDIIFKDGRKEKEWLEIFDLKDLISYAEKDIKENWKIYAKRCGYYEIE